MGIWVALLLLSVLAHLILFVGQAGLLLQIRQRREVDAPCFPLLASALCMPTRQQALTGGVADTIEERFATLHQTIAISRAEADALRQQLTATQSQVRRYRQLLQQADTGVTIVAPVSGTATQMNRINEPARFAWLEI